ncbi:MAG: GerMN domain-containing protein [Lachnospiraceae bacterium]|nr:GerMN domain-containing protein [Lachnospiraceae bacterium]
MKRERKHNFVGRCAPWIAALCLMLLTLPVGCSDENGTPMLEEGQYYTYYVNSSGTALVSRIYEPEAQDTQGLIEELLEQCQTAPTDGDGRRAVPSNVVVSGPPVLEERIVNLYFDTTYTTMDKVTELLCKAALAKTITQMEEVDYIRIYVNGEVYKGNYFAPSTGEEAELPGTSNQMGEQDTPGSGNATGNNASLPPIASPVTPEKTLWSGSDFLDNTGDDTNKYLQAELTLYFANAEGKALVAETRQVVYSSTLSMERVVLNQLIEGPQSADLTATLPKNLKIQGVSLRDSVCYVDFDATFLEEPVNVTDMVEIYSIVNSLTQLDNVLQVQITINGSADAVLRNNISLSGRFEKDLNLIYVSDDATEESTQTTTEAPTEPTTEEPTSAMTEDVTAFSTEETPAA